MRNMARRLAVLAIAALLPVTAAPATASAAPSWPPAPVDLYATNTGSSISLSWTEPAMSVQISYFRVYEGSTVVARNDTTHVTIRNLAFYSSHTYTVTAVSTSGVESAPSAPITRRAFVGGPVACGFAPSALTATAVSASGVSLSWSNAIPSYVQLFGAAGMSVVYLDSVEVTRTPLDSARVSGLAPSSTHTLQVGRLDCQGRVLLGPSITVTTAAGAAARPATPTGLTVAARTSNAVILTWAAASSGNDPTAKYNVYDGGSLIATAWSTTVPQRGLYRDTAHQFTVAAVDAAGNESAQSAPATTTTLTCGTVPAPVAVTASAVAPSTVTLSWVSNVEATSFTVYRVDGTASTPVTTVAASSAVVSGLPSGTGATFTVVTQATSGCGTSPASAPVSTVTPAGPSARPNAPTGLAVTSSVAHSDFTATVTLTWSQADNADPAVSYRLYEGSSVLATTQSPGISLTLPSGPTHQLEAVAVDAAGNESALSAPVTFTAPYIPIP